MNAGIEGARRAVGHLLVTGLFATVVLGAAWTARADDHFTFGGKVYTDLTYKDNEDKGTGLKSDDSGFGTDLKRFYLQFGYKYDDVWSATFVSDVGDQGTKRYDIFVKKAYIEAKLSPRAIFRMGSADLPWVPFVEDLYGYRYVENVLIDRAGFGTSADWGLHVKGGTGMFSYAAGVINGKGYSNPSRTGSVDFTGRVSVEPVEGLVLGAGAYSGKLGQDTDASPALHTASRYDLVAAFHNDRFNVGGEYFSADNWKTVAKPQTDSSDGYMLWLSVPVSKAELFFRYDSVSPSKDLAPDLDDTYYLAGVQIHPIKPLLVAFAYKHETVENGKWGSVGSTVPGAKGESDEIGMWTQFKW